MATGKCPNCGRAYGVRAKFCNECGEPVHEIAVPEKAAPAEVLTDAALDELEFTLKPDTSARASAAAPDSPGASACGSTAALHPTDAPRPSNAARCLEVINGPRAGHVLMLEENLPIVIGTGPSADLVLADDPRVSRQHATIVVHGGAIQLTDENSTNGVFVQVRKTTKLLDGDVVLLGRTYLYIGSVKCEAT